MATIPICDLSQVEETEDPNSSPSWKTAAGEIRSGLGSTGFLYVVNHGIPQDLIDTVFHQSQLFFSLDSEIKSKYGKNLTKTGNGFNLEEYGGYTPAGGEKLQPDAKFELKETFDWLPSTTGPVPEAPEFLENISKLDQACKQFLNRFLRLLALSLDLELNFFLENCRHFEDPSKYPGLYNIRLLHYPPISPQQEIPLGDCVRCGEHSDYGFLTLLFQDSVGGLEIKTVGGFWTEATPIPGSILINTGDLIEFWTKGIFPATPHRIVVPPISHPSHRQSRYSVAFFNGPDANCLVTPLNIVKTEQEVQRLEKSEKAYPETSIQAGSYLAQRVAEQYT